MSVFNGGPWAQKEIVIPEPKTSNKGDIVFINLGDGYYLLDQESGEWNWRTQPYED